MSTTEGALPGDTLKRIITERRYMKEFFDWMQRRLDLDKKYLEELKALRVSANPEWSQSNVSPLISPMLEFLARERQATYDATNTDLQELSGVNSPNWNEETGESAISKYDDLIAACKRHEVCREEASSITAVKEMQQWHEQGPNGTDSQTLGSMTDTDLSRFVLPETERNYRESVVQQQQLARVVNGWHHSRLPEHLDSHQSRSEEVQALVARVISEHSHLLTALIGCLEATKNSIHRFSSGSFISWAHDQCETESEHRDMKEAVHVDFWNGRTRSHIIFGSASQTPLEVRGAMKLLEEEGKLQDLYLADLAKDKVLELELSLAIQTGVPLALLPDYKLMLICSIGLLSNPPLIPLLEEDINRYRAGVPRNRLHIIMSRVSKQDEIVALLNILYSSSTNLYRSSLDKLLTHRKQQSSISSRFEARRDSVALAASFQLVRHLREINL
ncbi:hypothetical protein CPB86DRAFT_511692 [Serendipita vermifera]|nr:hypothetical protein CPB86DRAFT_511692 [Serendipita vermifera]